MTPRSAYPLSWRALDALEALARLWPKALAGAVPWLLLAPALAIVGLLLWGLVAIGDDSLRTIDFRTYRLSEERSAANYARALGEPLFLTVLWRSVLGAAVVTALTLTLAFPYAYLMTRTASPAARKTLLAALFLPFFIGQVVRAYGWLIILGREGLVNDALGAVGIEPLRMLFTYPAVLFGLVQYMLPFAVLLLAPALSAIPGDVERAAESLGASWPSALRHVVLPMAAPGLVGAGVVVMTLTLTDFAMPAILGGGSNDFVANLIYDQFFRTSDSGYGAAMTVLLVLLGSTLAGVALAAAGAGALALRRP